MHFTFTVEVDVERSEGKFASREDIGDQIQQEIESADPGTITGENDGTYDVTSWEVEQQEQARPGRHRR